MLEDMMDAKSPEGVEPKTSEGEKSQEISGPSPKNVAPVEGEPAPKKSRKTKAETPNIPKKKANKSKAPTGIPMDETMLAPGYTLLVGAIHDVLAVRMGEHWRLSAQEAGTIGDAMAKITATLMPMVDAKWLIVGMSLSQIVGIEVSHAMSAPAPKVLQPATGPVAVTTAKTPKNNVSFLDPTAEPIGQPESTQEGSMN